MKPGHQVADDRPEGTETGQKKAPATIGKLLNKQIFMTISARFRSDFMRIS